MKRVICSRPNASTLISGVPFTTTSDGRHISAEIDDATADMFLSIPGYILDESHEDEKKAKERAALEAKAAADAKKAAADAKKQQAALAKKLAAEAASNADTDGQVGDTPESEDGQVF